jgi:isovaleryl-CoA dehydrogenase
MAVAEERRNTLAANGFRLTPDQEEILDQADRFAEKTFFPLQQKMDDEEWWPPQTMPQLASMGFLGVTVSPELGGAIETTLVASGRRPSMAARAATSSPRA